MLRDVCSECNAWICSGISGISGITTSRAMSCKSSSSGSHNEEVESVSSNILLRMGISTSSYCT